MKKILKLKLIKRILKSKKKSLIFFFDKSVFFIKE